MGDDNTCPYTFQESRQTSTQLLCALEVRVLAEYQCCSLSAIHQACNHTTYLFAKSTVGVEAKRMKTQGWWTSNTACIYSNGEILCVGAGVVDHL